MYAGDRVRLLTEQATFGTLLSTYEDRVSVKLDDGRAVTVEATEVLSLH